MSDLKLIIKEIYQKLSLSRSPKATDIKEYFEVTKTNVITESGKKTGFKLGRRLR